MTEEFFEQIFEDLDDDGDTFEYIFSNSIGEDIKDLILNTTVKLWKTRPETNNITEKEFSKMVMISIINRIIVNTDDGLNFNSVVSENNK